MGGAYKDLREFLSVLEQEGQMLRIHDQVLPEPDIAAAACALTEIGEDSPAIHFDNIAGFTDARVAMNVHGSWCNHALALGMDKDASMRDQVLAVVRRFGYLQAHVNASRARHGKRLWSRRT